MQYLLQTPSVGTFCCSCCQQMHLTLAYYTSISFQKFLHTPRKEEKKEENVQLYRIDLITMSLANAIIFLVMSTGRLQRTTLGFRV